MEAGSRNTAIDMSVEEYLRGCVGFDVPDSAINTILADRKLAPGTSIHDMERKDKDLCRADLYMWCAGIPSVTGSVEDANGVWKHKEGGTQISVYDKRALRQMANDIYSEYGEKTKGSTMRVVGFGMALSRRGKA
jgi:hypothetical protein